MQRGRPFESLRFGACTREALRGPSCITPSYDCKEEARSSKGYQDASTLPASAWTIAVLLHGTERACIRLQRPSLWVFDLSSQGSLLAECMQVIKIDTSPDTAGAVKYITSQWPFTALV